MLDALANGLPVKNGASVLGISADNDFWIGNELGRSFDFCPCLVSSPVNELEENWKLKVPVDVVKL